MTGSRAAVMCLDFFPAKISMTASYLAHVHYFSTCNHVGWNQISAFERREFQLESANPILINFDWRESRLKLKKETRNLKYLL